MIPAWGIGLMETMRSNAITTVISFKRIREQEKAVGRR